jgi:hypothetical protein
MPEIPVFDNTATAPLGAPFPYADAASFEAPAKSLGQAGASIEAAGTDWGTIYANAKRTQDSTNLTASGMQQLEDLKFRLSKTDDSQAALAAYQTGAATILHNTLAQTSDPEVTGYVQRSLTTQSIIGAEDTRNAAFGVESSKFRGQLDTTTAGYAQNAALATSEAGRQQYKQLGNDAIDGAVANHWLAPEEGAQRKLAFTSQVAEVNAKRMISTDPVRAAALLENPGATAQAFPGLLPERASSLAGEASMRAMRVEGRIANAVAHQDAMARINEDRAIRQNETGVLADIYDGKPVSRAQVDEMGRLGQLTPGGFMVIQGALVNAPEGKDDIATLLHLQAGLNDHTLTQADIMAAAQRSMNGGSQGISRASALELSKGLGEQGKVQDNATYAAGLAQVRLAFNAAAAERGVFGKDEEGEANLAMVTQAEYIRRALLGKEDPQKTAADIVARYQQPPSSAQQIGADFVSTRDDLSRVIAKDQAAVRAGTMDQATYEGRARNLERLGAMLNARGGVPLPAQALPRGPPVAVVAPPPPPPLPQTSPMWSGDPTMPPVQPQ